MPYVGWIIIMIVLHSLNYCQSCGGLTICNHCNFYLFIYVLYILCLTHFVPTSWREWSADFEKKLFYTRWSCGTWLHEKFTLWRVVMWHLNSGSVLKWHPFLGRDFLRSMLTWYLVLRESSWWRHCHKHRASRSILIWAFSFSFFFLTKWSIPLAWLVYFVLKNRSQVLFILFLIVLYFLFVFSLALIEMDPQYAPQNYPFSTNNEPLPFLWAWATSAMGRQVPRFYLIRDYVYLRAPIAGV